MNAGVASAAAAADPAGTPRLRLGVDFHSFDGIYQGSRSHLLGLYRQAIVQAPDIDFLFLLAQPAALRQAHAEFSLANVTLIEMPHRPGAWRLFWQLSAMQRRHRLDLLHVQFRLPLVASGACICTLHDVLFETHPQYFSRGFAALARSSARHAVRRARITLTVSNYSRLEIARHYPIEAQRVVLTPNAVDPQRFHARGESPQDAATLARWGLSSEGYLCTLGRLEPRKNQAALVQAFAQLPPDTPPLIMIGQRDFAYDAVFRQIHALGIGNRVRILEDVDDAALPVLLRHARLMAYPSHAEGFGMPVLEALASGVPVVTSNTTSLPEIAGQAAWLVAPTDVPALAEALRQCLAEAPAARQARIARGLRHAARFSWAESAANLLAAVREATTIRDRPSPGSESQIMYPG
jgi:glycosyltransferase involved in cell wall biosynthesis